MTVIVNLCSPSFDLDRVVVRVGGFTGMGPSGILCRLRVPETL